MSSTYKYKRVLLKLSGEALKGQRDSGICPKTLLNLAEEIAIVKQNQIELGIVVGGGNIFRGVSGSVNGMDRSTADYIGMLATIMNSIAIQDALEKKGIPTRVMSAITVSELCEPYIKRRAIRHFEKGRVVIFSAGTGNPFFTTDTAACLRAVETNSEVILKATKVDGVYDSDPLLNKDAKFYSKLNYIECLNKRLKVMDATAISLCMDNNLPIIVFNLTKEGNIKKVLEGQNIGTMVGGNN